MKVFTEINPEYISNIYFVTDNDQKYGVIIDPGSFSENVYRLIKHTGAEIKKIIVTSNDTEKTAGIPIIKKVFDTQIFAYCDRILGFETEKVMNGSIIKEGDIEFKIIETPVYSYDSISILTNESLFVGSMFQAGSFNLNNELPSPSIYENEIIKKHILSLQDNVIIYPTHGPASTVEIEKKYNPLFQEIINDSANKT